jgi:AcrR family transcriptional regulator
VIDEVPRRRTRAEQRAATREAILQAAARCLVDDGYGSLTTRRVAELAEVAQSTLMHHFPTREALLVEAVSHLALRIADSALENMDLAQLRDPSRREAVLDQIWAEFTSPQALAAAQLWFVAGAEPELAAALRDLEERLSAMLMAMAGAVVPDLVEDPDFPALLDTGLSLIRGLVMSIPVWGREPVEQRWQAIRPVLNRAAGDLLDAPRPLRAARSDAA